MKRFSRKWFLQIMIHKLLKRELDGLKKIIAKETLVTWELSYGDVITYLVKYYKENKSIAYPVEQKLRVIIPLKKSSLSISSKLDGKQRVSYSLEN